MTDSKCLPATLTDEVLWDAFCSEPVGSWDQYRAVAALAIEHDRAEMLRAAGVDNVYEIARSAARPIRGCATDEQYSDLIQRVGDAIAPLAAERDRLAARVAELEACDSCVCCGVVLEGDPVPPHCDQCPTPVLYEDGEWRCGTHETLAARKGAQDE